MQEHFENYPLEDLHERVANLARSTGVPVLDLSEAFRGQSAHLIRVFDRDPHLNERGLMLAAEATVDFLIDQELPPRAP